MTAGHKARSPQFFADSVRLPKGGAFLNLIYPRHSPAREIDMTDDKTEAQPQALRLELHQECADFATSLRSAANVVQMQGQKAPPSFLKAADLFEQAAAEIQQLKAQLSARQAAPDGWRLVPVEPTEEMVTAGQESFGVHDCYYAMLSAAPPPPEREPLSDLQKQALAVYQPPFQFSHGYVFDSAGRMVADEGREHELDQLESTVGVRIRGWGHLGKLKNGAEVQDTMGELAAAALNAYWKQHGIGATNAR
jgi:hypothetical protein